jgi:hypothetical protein
MCRIDGQEWPGTTVDVAGAPVLVSRANYKAARGLGARARRAVTPSAARLRPELIDLALDGVRGDTR